MKRKPIIFILVAILVAILTLSIVACNPQSSNKDNKKNNSGKINIKILPDMVDYGASANYYKDGTIAYSDSKKAEWTNKLDGKRDSERDNWYDKENGAWSNSNYYSFGPKALGYLANEPAWQSNIGYFNVDGDWIDNESANTVERLFCYSTSEEFIKRMSEARLDEDKMDKLVTYICRDDEDRTKGAGYTYAKGTSSAIEDYNQLEELYDIYDDFSAYTKDNSYAKPKFESEDDVSDAVSRKKRKIFGELIDIYGEEADQFARSAIELVSYGIAIIDDTMLNAYNTAMDTDETFEDFMRNDIYDYETLSYILTFKDRTSFSNSTYKAIDKKEMMSLYGYYYQYESTEYKVFDDSVMVGDITEYEDYLKLSHKSYFESDAETLRNRDYDRRIYEKAYRYSTKCYSRYYTVQLGFQKVQEDKDMLVYKGGSVSQDNMGSSETKGQYANGLTAVDASTSYSKEMQLGCDIGLDSTLKLSDVNWEYTGEDKRVFQYNTASKGWNRLSESEQAAARNKILKVKLELEQLKSQDYAINHQTISEADLTKALKYEIRSYSADSIRGIQSCKKDEVILFKDIDRFLKVNPGYDFAELYADNYTTDIAHLHFAIVDLEEKAGRNNAKYANLINNFSYAGIDEQIATAENANWAGIKENIKTTLNEDYVEYAKKNNDVDEHFENTLIRKKYSCGAELTDTKCSKGNGHADCTEEYDTSWALSRLLHNHEKVIRYTAGQYVVTLKALDNSSIIAPDTFVGLERMTSREAVVNGTYRATYMSDDNCEKKTLDYNDEIGTVCRDSDSNGGYKSVETYPYQYWLNIPSYDKATNFTYDETRGVITVSKGGKTYTYTFIGWFVDENFKYRVNLDEAYNYDLRLYPAYQMEIG